MTIILIIGIIYMVAGFFNKSHLDILKNRGYRLDNNLNPLYSRNTKYYDL